MPTRFDALPTATWPRLRNLLDGHAAGGPVINMTIGEPKHKFPDWVRPTLVEAMEGFNSYPDNNGTPELRGAITGFLQRRYAIDLDRWQRRSGQIRSGWWPFIPCRNARTFRGCGRALWRRDLKTSHESNSCAPMLAVRWLDLSSMFLLRCGQTRIMLLLIGNCIVANLRRQIVFLPEFSPIIRQKPGFSCGCPSKMTKPLR